MADDNLDAAFHRRVRMHVSAAVTTCARFLNLDVTVAADGFVQDIAGQFASLSVPAAARYLRTLADLVEAVEANSGIEPLEEKLDAIVTELQTAAAQKLATLSAKRPATGAN